MLLFDLLLREAALGEDGLGDLRGDLDDLPVYGIFFTPVLESATNLAANIDNAATKLVSNPPF